MIWNEIKKYMGALNVINVDGFVDIKEKDSGPLSLWVGLFYEPFLGKIGGTSAIDENEELNKVVLAWIFYFFFQLGVGIDGVDFVVDAFALEEFLR